MVLVFLKWSLALSQAASVATLPSALVLSDCSLGASWVFLVSEGAAT
jgi:hypothetical protein